jgi:putative lipoprotein
LVYARWVRQGAHFIFPTVLALVALPRAARADDDWLGRDKALHFGVSVAISAGAYAGSSLIFEKPWERALAASLFSLGVGAGKEGFDALSGGDASFKDFAWDAAGTLVGTSIAFSIDVTWLSR